MEFVLLPKITEKTMAAAQEGGVYTFVAAGGTSRVNKTNVRQYVTENFKVTVEDVKVHNRIGKIKRFGKSRKEFKNRDLKLFLVKVKKGDTIPGFNLGEDKK